MFSAPQDFTCRQFIRQMSVFELHLHVCRCGHKFVAQTAHSDQFSLEGMCIGCPVCGKMPMTDQIWGKKGQLLY